MSPGAQLCRSGHGEQHNEMSGTLLIVLIPFTAHRNLYYKVVFTF